MLTEERQKRILDILARKGSVTVSELMMGLDASESTIRRDLNSMDREGLLTKVHGGAIAKNDNDAMQDYEVELRKAINTNEKLAIAKYAASLIKDNEFVYMDSGTTVEMMIDYITCSGTSFVTNSVNAAKMLSKKGFRTYILGGEFKTTTEAIVGEEAISNVEKYNFTKGFFGVNGIDVKCGFTTPEQKEGLIKKKAMEHSLKSYILADASKFGQVAPITFASYESATIITDSKPDGKYGKNVIVVE